MPHAGIVQVLRGRTIEATHLVHVAVADARGTLIASLGNPGLQSSLRSSAKPMQALPLVEEGVVDRFGLSDAELALCCASHQAEDAHLEGVRSILRKAGLEEADLRCGPHPPFDRRQLIAVTRHGSGPQPIHNNCSGKHAGMAALARAMGWPVEDYHRLDHPVQQRMLREICRWSGLAAGDIDVAVDGCGVACFSMSLQAMAGAFARFAEAAAEGGGPGHIVRAMTEHPHMVAGAGRLCTAAMLQGAGTFFLKTGAEGLYCGGVPQRGWGFAVKVQDGAKRAADVASVRVLEGLGLLDEAASAALAEFGRPKVLNTRDEVVGEVRAEFEVRVGGLAVD